MNLQDCIQRIKLWIDKQYLIIRHYRIVISIFLVIALGLITVGIFYPSQEESIQIHSDQLHDRASGQTQENSKELTEDISNKRSKSKYKGEQSIDGGENKTVSNGKGRLLYDVSSVERAHPWREVFRDFPSVDLLSRNDNTNDIDSDLDAISDDEISFSNKKLSNNKRTTRRHRVTKNKNTGSDRSNKALYGDMIYDKSNNINNANTYSIQSTNSNVSSLQEPIKLVGIIEGNEEIAILRKGSEEQMVTVGSTWKGAFISNITTSAVEIVEGGSSRWLTI